MFNSTCSKINHPKNNGAALIQPSEYTINRFRIGHNCSIHIKRPTFIQKSYFNIIHMGADQSFKYFYNISMTKFPIINISSIPKGAIK